MSGGGSIKGSGALPGLISELPFEPVPPVTAPPTPVEAPGGITDTDPQPERPNGTATDDSPGPAEYSAAMAEAAQAPGLDDYIALYQLDTAILGGGVYCFTSSAFSTEVITFDGLDYQPIDVETEGWEWNGRGALPRPTIRIRSAISISALVFEFGDLLGCGLTRIRTFRRYLDGQPDADPSVIMPIDVFVVERKVSMTKQAIEFELSAAMDQAGRSLPGRQVLRDTCTHVYRRFVDGAFDFTNATCPYAESASFTAAGVATTEALDRCGKKLSDCKLRFGNEQLPFRGFPGVAKVRPR